MLFTEDFGMRHYVGFSQIGSQIVKANIATTGSYNCMSVNKCKTFSKPLAWHLVTPSMVKFVTLAMLL